MRISFLAGFAFCFGLAATDLYKAPPSPSPDDRYKADILVIVAHPDDETEITGYLARAIYEEHRRVAVIFGTLGDSGGNDMGYEQAASLGAEREIEARRALASFQVMNVWFLGCPDTPGQDVLRSLETWNHGTALAKAVRLVRLTRPEVILTWAPLYVAGENHGDHQAAGVIATEAFDLAGDATAFPEQITAPRDRWDVGNLTEGLHPWQPKKIYYFSDASHTEFLHGRGPSYSTMDVSPSHRAPYYRLAAEEMSFHLTQGDTGQMAKNAIAKGDFKYFEEPVQLIFGKSLVKSSPTGDIFEGVSSAKLSFAPPPGYRTPELKGLTLELGGPWAFYRAFWKAHGIEHLAGLLQPEVQISPGQRLHVPLLVSNGEHEAHRVSLSIQAPTGWKQLAGPALYLVRVFDMYPAETVLEAPQTTETGWQKITFEANAEGRPIGSVTLRVKLDPGQLPQ
ncbi:MAG: PIG-L family deacetylase [Bryobacteraceae bacterium]